MRVKKTLFAESAITNIKAYGYYMAYLSEIAMSRFTWKNLPETVDERFMEMILYSDGQAVFFKDEVMGELVLQVVPNGPLNVYRIPIRRRPYAVGYNGPVLTENDSVIIYNNYLRSGNAVAVSRFAERLHNLDAIIDINANAQKTPILLKGTVQQRLTLVNLYKKYDGNMPVIFGEKTLDPNGISVIKTDAPFVADKLYQIKSHIWDEALTYLGISSMYSEKRERLVSDEVNMARGATIASRQPGLKMRKMAAEKINKMFGLNIEVEYSEEIEDRAKAMFAAAVEQGTASEFLGENGGETVE